MADQLATGQMAERCGLTPHTLRYYERIGLIQLIARGTDGHRRYSAQGQRVLDSLKDIAPDFARYLIEFPFGDIYSRAPAST